MLGSPVCASHARDFQNNEPKWPQRTSFILKFHYVTFRVLYCLKCNVFISAEINILNRAGGHFFFFSFYNGATNIDVTKAVKGPHWGNLIQTWAQFISHDQHTAAQKSLGFQFVDWSAKKLSWKTFHVLFFPNFLPKLSN